MSFGKDMQKWVKKAGISMENAVKSVRIQGLTGIIQRTPVDTGRARSSWVATTGEPSKTEFGEQEDYPSDAALINLGIKEANKNVDDVFYFTSNLPYIRRLEYDPKLQKGYSTQAPSGMVRVTIEEIKAGLKQVIK